MVEIWPNNLEVTVSSLGTTTLCIMSKVSFGWICGEDLNYFKRYYFNAFVLSSGPMQHDTRLVDMISGGFEGLSLPKGTRLDHLLTNGIDVGLLKEETMCHAPVSNLSGLSLSVTLKWDSDFDEIFQRLKSEKKWSEFSDVSLKTALIEHFSLLHKLNDNLDISVGNMSEGDSILEAITKDYSEELSRLTKGIAEVRMKNYVDHLEFKSLVNKCAAQAKALSTEVIAKGQSGIWEFLMKDLRSGEDGRLGGDADPRKEETRSAGAHEAVHRRVDGVRPLEKHQQGPTLTERLSPTVVRSCRNRVSWPGNFLTIFTGVSAASDCALNPQKLFRLKDRAMTAESWMLEKFSRLKGRVRGNYVGPFTRGVPAFLLLAALSVAALGTLEDRKA
ncbi:hypothetical protein TEA_012284 [Camellia sinensis var. sinensis]|uniref:Uncharacterized protein n=1 Tax=Camellia sinensis var. sinensis TaxID=542762 RepID=A0A4S4E8S5_CAMSN|nr:hypothetical protein TEA_012284 [Camellia sinensis var. sinensis]